MPVNPELYTFELGGGPDLWPQHDAKLFQPYGVEQILVPDNANCLAVQAYLKMCGLPFEIEYRANAEFMSPNGSVPFIKCGNHVVADFDQIVLFVESKGISLTSDLNSAEKNDLIAYKTLVNYVLKNSELYICWVDKETYNAVTKPRYGSVFSWPLNIIQTRSKRSSVLSHLKAINYDQKSIQDIYEDVENCCRALSDRLNGQEYFFGSKPTELDALIYGHVYSITTTAFPDCIKLHDIIGFYPSLINHMKMVGRKYFRISCPLTTPQRRLSSSSLVSGTVSNSQDSIRVSMIFPTDDVNGNRPNLKTRTNPCDRLSSLKSLTRSKDSNSLCVLICLIDYRLKSLKNPSEQIPRIHPTDIKSFEGITEYDLNDALDIEKNEIITHMQKKLNMNAEKDSVKHSMVLLNEILSCDSSSQEKCFQKATKWDDEEGYEEWKKDVDGLLQCIIKLFRLGYIRFDNDNVEELETNEKSLSELNEYMNFATNIVKKSSNKMSNHSSKSQINDVSFEIAQKEENSDKKDSSEKLLFNLAITETSDKATSISRLRINHSLEYNESVTQIPVAFAIFSVLHRLFFNPSALITYRQNSSSIQTQIGHLAQTSDAQTKTEQFQTETRKEIGISQIEHIISLETVTDNSSYKTYITTCTTSEDVADNSNDGIQEDSFLEEESPKENKNQPTKEFAVSRKEIGTQSDNILKANDPFAFFAANRDESEVVASESKDNRFSQLLSHFIRSDISLSNHKNLNTVRPKSKVAKSLELLSKDDKPELAICTKIDSKLAYHFMMLSCLRDMLATNLKSTDNIDCINRTTRWFSTAYISYVSGEDKKMVFVNVQIPRKKEDPADDQIESPAFLVPVTETKSSDKNIFNSETSVQESEDILISSSTLDFSESFQLTDYNTPVYSSSVAKIDTVTGVVDLRDDSVLESEKENVEIVKIEQILKKMKEIEEAERLKHFIDVSTQISSPEIKNLDQITNKDGKFLSSAYIPLFDEFDVEYNEGSFRIPTRSDSSILSTKSIKTSTSYHNETTLSTNVDLQLSEGNGMKYSDKLEASSVLRQDLNMKVIHKNSMVCSDLPDRSFSGVFDEGSVELEFPNEVPPEIGDISKISLFDNDFIMSESSNRATTHSNFEIEIPKRACACKKKHLSKNQSKKVPQKTKNRLPNENKSDFSTKIDSERNTSDFPKSPVLQQANYVQVDTLLSPKFLKETYSSNAQNVAITENISSSAFSDTKSPFENFELKFKIDGIDENKLLKYCQFPIKKNELGLQICQEPNNLSFAWYRIPQTDHPTTRKYSEKSSEIDQIKNEIICNDDLIFDINDLKEEMLDFLLIGSDSSMDISESIKSDRYRQNLQLPDSYVEIKFHEDDLKIVFKPEHNKLTKSAMNKSGRLTISDLSSYDLHNKNLFNFNKHFQFDTLTAVKSNLSSVNVSEIFSINGLNANWSTITQLHTKYLGLVTQFVYYMNTNPPNSKSSRRKLRRQSRESVRQNSNSVSTITEDEDNVNENERLITSSSQSKTSPMTIAIYDFVDSNFTCKQSSSFCDQDPTNTIDHLSMLDSNLGDLSSHESVDSKIQSYLLNDANGTSDDSQTVIFNDNSAKKYLSFSEWNQQMGSKMRQQSSTDSTYIEKRVVSGNKELKAALHSLDNVQISDLLYQSSISSGDLSFLFHEAEEKKSEVSLGKLMYLNTTSQISMHSIIRPDEVVENERNISQSNFSETKHRNRSSLSMIQKMTTTPEKSLSFIDTPLLYSDLTVYSDEINQILKKESIITESDNNGNLSNRRKKSSLKHVVVNEPDLMPEPEVAKIDNMKPAIHSMKSIKENFRVISLSDIVDADSNTGKTSLSTMSSIRSSINSSENYISTKTSTLISGDSCVRDLPENKEISSASPKVVIKQNVDEIKQDDFSFKTPTNDDKLKSIPTNDDKLKSTTNNCSCSKRRTNNDSNLNQGNKITEKIIEESKNVLSNVEVAKNDSEKLNEYIKCIRVEDITYNIPSHFDEILAYTSSVSLAQIKSDKVKYSVSNDSFESSDIVIEEDSLEFTEREESNLDIELPPTATYSDLDDISVEPVPIIGNYRSDYINQDTIEQNMVHSNSIQVLNENNTNLANKSQITVVKGISQEGYGANHYPSNTNLEINISEILNSESEELPTRYAHNRVRKSKKKMDNANQFTSQHVYVQNKSPMQDQIDLNSHMINLNDIIITNTNASMETFPVLQENQPVDCAYRCKREMVSLKNKLKMQKLNNFDNSCSCRPLPNTGPCICNVHRGLGSGSICYGTEGSIYPSSTQYDYYFTTSYDLSRLNIDNFDCFTTDDNNKSLEKCPQNYDVIFHLAISLLNKYMSSYTIKSIDLQKRNSDLVEIVDLNLGCEDFETIETKSKRSIKITASKFLKDMKERFATPSQAKNMLKQHDTVKISKVRNFMRWKIQADVSKKPIKDLVSGKFYFNKREQLMDMASGSSCENKIIDLDDPKTTSILPRQVITAETDKHLQDLEQVNCLEKMDLSHIVSVQNILKEIILNIGLKNEITPKTLTQKNSFEELIFFKGIDSYYKSNIRIENDNDDPFYKELSDISEEGSNFESENSSIYENKYPIVPYQSIQNLWPQKTTLVELPIPESDIHSLPSFTKINSPEFTVDNVMVNVFEKPKLSMEDTRGLENSSKYFLLAEYDLVPKESSVNNSNEKIPKLVDSPIKNDLSIRPKSSSGPTKEVEPIEIIPTGNKFKFRGSRKSPKRRSRSLSHSAFDNNEQNSDFITSTPKTSSHFLKSSANIQFDDRKSTKVAVSAKSFEIKNLEKFQNTPPGRNVTQRESQVFIISENKSDFMFDLSESSSSAPSVLNEEAHIEQKSMEKSRTEDLSGKSLLTDKFDSSIVWNSLSNVKKIDPNGFITNFESRICSNVAIAKSDLEADLHDEQFESCLNLSSLTKPKACGSKHSGVITSNIRNPLTQRQLLKESTATSNTRRSSSPEGLQLSKHFSPKFLTSREIQAKKQNCATSFFGTDECDIHGENLSEELDSIIGLLNPSHNLPKPRFTDPNSFTETGNRKR